MKNPFSSTEELVRFMQQSLETQGYLVIGSDVAYSVGDVVDTPIGAYGVSAGHCGVKVIGNAVAQDLDAQLLLIGFKDDIQTEWPYHYKVIAE